MNTAALLIILCIFGVTFNKRQRQYRNGLQARRILLRKGQNEPPFCLCAMYWSARGPFERLFCMLWCTTART